MPAELDRNRATTLPFRERTNSLDGHVTVLVDEAPNGLFVDALWKDHATGDVVSQVAAAGILLVPHHRQMVSFELDIQSVWPTKARLTEHEPGILALEIKAIMNFFQVTEPKISMASRAAVNLS